MKNKQQSKPFDFSPMSDDENPEWTTEEIKSAIPFSEAFPDLYASIKKKKNEITAKTSILVNSPN